MKKLLQNLGGQCVLLGPRPAGRRDMFPHRGVPHRFAKLVGKQDRCIQPDHARSKNPSAKFSRPIHGTLMSPTDAGSVACQRGVRGFAELRRKFSIGFPDQFRGGALRASRKPLEIPIDGFLNMNGYRFHMSRHMPLMLICQGQARRTEARDFPACA